MITATPDDIARFHRYTDKLPNGCWYWTGARSRGKGNKKWYGSFHVRDPETGKGRTVRAHRFACEVLGNKPCPPEHDRDHICSFSMCVNPKHIVVVTKRRNTELREERKYSVVDLDQLNAKIDELLLRKYNGYA